MLALTRSGLGVLLAAVVIGGVGWWWNYEELVVIAAGMSAMVLVAIWMAQRPLAVEIVRRLVSVRVPRGDAIRLRYQIRNDGRLRSGGATIVDQCDGATCRVPVGPLVGGTAEEVAGAIPTRRRGVYEVGPLEIERVDPFWLAVGRRRAHITATVTIHPRIHDLAGPQGALRVIQSESALRRPSNDPMSGFVSLREYVLGDDPRLIHWPTTARVGQLMVREHVEVRRPELTLTLDTSRRVGTADDFEEAVDVAASLAVHAIRSGLDVVLRTTSRSVPGHRRPLTDEQLVLDLLTLVQQTDDADTLPLGALFRGGFDHRSVVVVTGPDGPASRLTTPDHVAAVRIGRGAQMAPGITLSANDAVDFVRRWRTWT